MLKNYVNAHNLKQAGKVAVAVGAGALLAQGGSAAIKRASTTVNDFAKGGDPQEALVDAVAGVALGTGALLLVGIAKPALAKQVAPFVLGGAIMSALAPMIAPRVAGYIDDAISMILPGAKAPAISAADAAKQVGAGRGVIGLVQGNAGSVGTPGGINASRNFAYGGVPGGIGVNFPPNGLNNRAGIGGVPGGANAVQRIGGVI